MKIILAVDGSEFSKAAIAECSRIYKSNQDLQFKIVSAVEPPAAIYEAPYALSAENRQTLETLGCKIAEGFAASAERTIRESFPGSGLSVTICVRTGSPAQIIVEEAEKANADLIVMGSHGYGFWRRALLGSISQSVIHHAPCSVLIVRKHEKMITENQTPEILAET